MTDQELARALFNAGLLTQEQIQSAAAQRSAGQNFAQTVVSLGWLSADQITQIDPTAFGGSAGVTSFSSSAPPPLQSTPPGGYQPPGGYAPPSGYPQPGYSQPATYTEQVNGTTILVLGILGLVCCQICAPIAWVMGNTAMSTIDSGRADPAERSNVNIGRILGIIGTILMVLVFLFYLLMFIGMLGKPIPNTFNNAPGMFNSP